MKPSPIYWKSCMLCIVIILGGCASAKSAVNPTQALFEASPIQTAANTMETPPAYPVETSYPATVYPLQITPEAYSPPALSAATSSDDGPLATLPDSDIPTPTIPPTFTPSATLPLYTGKPFSIVFADSDLWLVEIGGKIERQLTHEPEGWYISRFDVNRRGDRIAYITIKMNNSGIVDGMIKLVDLRTGEVRPLLGMGDGVIENQLKWLDDTHLAYTYEEFSYYHINTPTAPTPTGGYHTFDYFIFDLATGQTTYSPKTIDISQSPDGRFRLICARTDPLGNGCEFNLHDLVHGQTWMIAQASNWGWFKGWSSNSKWMLFINLTYSNSPSDHKFLVVNSVTHSSTWVDPPGDHCNSTSWAFHSANVACSVCDNEHGCQILFWGPDGTQTKPPIHLPKPFYIVSWTPDDTRLLLFPEDGTLWIINVDGTGLRQVLNNSLDWVVLPQSP